MVKPTHIFNIKGNIVTLKRNDHITRLTGQNCSNRNYRYNTMYVESIHNYFSDFRKPVNCATMKMEITIENSRSLKLRHICAWQQEWSMVYFSKLQVPLCLA